MVPRCGRVAHTWKDRERKDHSVCYLCHARTKGKKTIVRFIMSCTETSGYKTEFYYSRVVCKILHKSKFCSFTHPRAPQT